ncbi:MAG TPA: TrkH family potassium uptake protein [Acidimicrobiales bacterium]|nr:TrkH family potassium uptake protein [Acidimicrobiales bacterium]
MTLEGARARLEPRRRRPSLPVHVAALSSTVAGIAMVLGAIVDQVDGGPDVAALVLCGVPTTLVGLVVWRGTEVPKEVRTLEVFVTVTVAWMALAVVGAVPYLATGRLTAPDQALFESISGFTTTGATILRPIAETSQGLLFYRALTQWIGGMGVIVLVIAVLPTVGSGAMNLMTAEAPGPAGERLSPRVRHTARNLWSVYVGFTLAVVAAYVLAGMSLFDGFAHAFTTVSTGGFSPHNGSLAHFDSAAIEWIAIASMFLAGGSFALYYRALRGQVRPLLRSFEFGAYAAIVIGATAIVFAAAEVDASVAAHVRDSFFTITSVVSTTGYATADFGEWSQGAQIVVMLLLPIGAMAGSTAGGVKLVRVLAIASFAHRAALSQLHPRLVRPVRVGARALPEEIATRIVGFMVLALVVFGGGALLIALTGPDMITSFSAAASSFGNVGPGLGDVGPAYDYLTLPWTARVVTMAQMLLGRLEIYPVILALSVVTLRRRLHTASD